MKVTCDIVSDLLQSYIDDVCSEDSRRVVEEHICFCEKCNKKLQDMKNPIECPTVLTDRKNPFKKIRKRHHLQIIIAIVATVCIVGGSMYAIQEIGTLHDFFCPLDMAVVDNETDSNEWCQVKVSGKNRLNFNSIFYSKKLVNDANSSGNVMIRILDEDNRIVIDETLV